MLPEYSWNTATIRLNGLNECCANQILPILHLESEYSAHVSMLLYLEAVETGIGFEDQLLMVLQWVDVAIGHKHCAKSLGL